MHRFSSHYQRHEIFPRSSTCNHAFKRLAASHRTDSFQKPQIPFMHPIPTNHDYPFDRPGTYSPQSPFHVTKHRSALSAPPRRSPISDGMHEGYNVATSDTPAIQHYPTLSHATLWPLHDQISSQRTWRYVESPPNRHASSGPTSGIT